MANETNYSPCKYKGNGETLNFPFEWNYFKDAEIIVNIEDDTGAQSTLLLGQDYTINADSVGGEVICKVAPTNNEYIIISRDTSVLQEARYSTSIGFQGSEVEKSFDKVSCCLQDMLYLNKRSIKTPVGSSALDLSLPQPNAGKTLKWNSSNTGLVNSEVDIDNIASYMENAKNYSEKTQVLADNATAAASEIQTAKTEILNLIESTKGKLSGYHPPLLSCMWSDHLLNDIQWLRADTFSWQNGKVIVDGVEKDGVYSAVYNKLLSEWNDPNAKVLINVNVIGTPTIADNGDVQGFSTTSYLTKEVDFSNETKDTLFPIVFNFTTSTIVTGYHQAISDTNNFTYALFMNTDGKLILKLGSNGTSFDITDGTVGTTVLSPATQYKVILDYDGTNYTLELTNLSTNTTTTEITVASTSLIQTVETTISLGLALDQTSIWTGLISVPNCSIGTVWHGTKGHKSSNGFIILDPAQEQWVLDTYNDTGVAWYYILDSANTRFKLARTKYGFVGLRDSVGNIVDIATSGTDTKATQMYLYFYVGSYTQTAIEQTAGITSEQLNSKVDNSSLVEAQVITETYKNGTSWYRLWSDGFKEQGGQIYQNANADVVITFLVPFDNNEYFAVRTAGWSGHYDNSIYGCHAVNIWNATKTSMTIRTYNADGLNTQRWYACGY
mgnify:CR=1 FL=1